TSAVSRTRTRTAWPTARWTRGRRSSSRRAASGAEADEADHAAGVARLAAERVVPVGRATGAVGDVGDVVPGQAGCAQLPAVLAAHVQVRLAARAGPEEGRRLRPHRLAQLVAH